MLLLASCAEDASQPMVVFAASSLEGLIPEAPGSKVIVRFDSSSRLARQAEAGAHLDVFITARPSLLGGLRAEGRIAADRILGHNRLVLAAREARDCPDLMEREGPSIGLAAETVPLGIYAEQALRASGQWPAAQARGVRGSTARSVTRWLVSGELSAAVVYETDAHNLHVCHRFDPATHDPIEYVGAVVQNAGTVHPSAEAFLSGLELEGLPDL